MELLHEDSAFVGNLIASNECVTPSTVVSEVADRFFVSSSTDALALVEGREPVGIVTRPKLLFSLFRRYGFELFGRKPVITIADTQPLILNESERLDVAMDKALDRPAQDIYDEIIVVDDGDNYKGLLSVKQMVIHQSNALANSMVQKELAHSKARELEKLGKVKSQFIANVTHELRSPVNSILMLTELIDMAYKKGYFDQVKDRLSLLMSSATSLRAIITNILDLSKIEAGKMDIICESFNIVGLLHEIADTTRILIGNKPVEVEVNARQNSLHITSDPIKVRQVLVNLTSNAVKFTEKGGITLTLTEDDCRIKISVSDTGVGIRDEDLNKLFVAFSQIEDAKTKRHEGTGLGLTITKNLIDLLGGSISVSSKYGQGSIFEISLPAENKKC
jgi:signal transduction histidine kinase